MQRTREQLHHQQKNKDHLFDEKSFCSYEISDSNESQRFSARPSLKTAAPHNFRDTDVAQSLDVSRDYADTLTSTSSSGGGGSSDKTLKGEFQLKADLEVDDLPLKDADRSEFEAISTHFRNYKCAKVAV
jgi:hypothetical protein